MPDDNLRLTLSRVRVSFRNFVTSYSELFLLALLALATLLARSVFGWELSPTVQAFLKEHQYYLVLAVIFGAMVGASEIISRYRDEPYRATFSPPGRIYMLLNGLISLAAYVVLVKYRANVLPALGSDNLMTSVVAGFGAMVFMRSKLFNFRTEGGENFSVGPDAVLSTFLSSVNRRIDRFLSAIRQEMVYQEVVAVLKPQNAPKFLEIFLTAYQSIPAEEKKELADDIKAVLDRKDLDDQLKLMAISFGFMNIGGYKNFKGLMALLKRYQESPPLETTGPNPTPGP
ncbi:MAG: hypothetical protein ND895_02480 [Pyrinomonadaceae bacterium]|nr:hypothetical protein [Pyrinomonadaceae bacterium]